MSGFAKMVELKRTGVGQSTNQDHGMLTTDKRRKNSKANFGFFVPCTPRGELAILIVLTGLIETFGNKKGMKKNIPIIQERESEAFILGNGREQEFLLTPAKFREKKSGEALAETVFFSRNFVTLRADFESQN